MAEVISVDELRRKPRNVSQRIGLELLLCSDCTVMQDLVIQGINHVAQLMSRNPELKQEHSEDELTIELISGLYCMGFDARHETKVGGHCDIVIEGDDNFLWLGEAKKFDADYGWLMSGFNQLTTRYSTGSTDQVTGGIIIYVFAPRTDRILRRWGEKLVAEVPELSVDLTTDTNGYILSVHPHQRTGASFTTWHRAISLLWRPA